MEKEKKMREDLCICVLRNISFDKKYNLSKLNFVLNS